MSKVFTGIALLLAQCYSFAAERELIWPAGKMPDVQEHQIAAMTNETSKSDFKADEHRCAYIEWGAAPAPEVDNDGCMILISGGAYSVCCDVGLVRMWEERFTALGFQCVNLVYRTPRPVGIPFYQSAWEDGQRAVRMIRSEAARRGFDPEKIGSISMSAGSHLATLLATNSQTPAYPKIDALDDYPCHINWAILNATAYVLTDGPGVPCSRMGIGPDVQLDPLLKFDKKTCPMSLHQGGIDTHSPTASTMLYRQLRRMGVPAELHLYPNKGHGAFGLDRAVEFLRQMGLLGRLEPEVDLLTRFPGDEARERMVREAVWPEGKMPNRQEEQCEPYLEWHFPKELKTKAIQIIYSGGAYYSNDPDGVEVAPPRRFLNEKGMTVVTLKYRTPAPSAESGLAKHTTSWQDLQRTIKIVRNKAADYGLDPDRIGIMGYSAGGHMTLMGVTSSRQISYWPVDDIDKLSCKVQWGIAIFPAYVLTDGVYSTNKNNGNGDGDVIVPEFNFDLDTAPTLFLHGDEDKYSPMGSVKVWERMRAMGVQSELHLLAKRGHSFEKKASPGTASYNYLDRIWDFLTEGGFNK